MTSEQPSKIQQYLANRANRQQGSPAQPPTPQRTWRHTDPIKQGGFVNGSWHTPEPAPIPPTPQTPAERGVWTRQDVEQALRQQSTTWLDPLADIDDLAELHEFVGPAGGLIDFSSICRHCSFPFVHRLHMQGVPEQTLLATAETDELDIDLDSWDVIYLDGENAGEFKPVDHSSVDDRRTRQQADLDLRPRDRGIPITDGWVTLPDGRNVSWRRYAELRRQEREEQAWERPIRFSPRRSQLIARAAMENQHSISAEHWLRRHEQ